MKRWVKGGGVGEEAGQGRGMGVRGWGVGIPHNTKSI